MTGTKSHIIIMVLKNTRANKTNESAETKPNIHDETKRAAAKKNTETCTSTANTHRLVVLVLLSLSLEDASLYGTHLWK